MSLKFEIGYRVTDEADHYIVALTITTAFTVPPDNAVKHAEDVVVEIARRLSGKDESFVRERLAEQFWLNETDRPEETPPP